MRSHHKVILLNILSNSDFSSKATDLLQKMLKKDPKERLSAKDALSHSWILAKGEIEDQGKQSIAVLNFPPENLTKLKEKYESQNFSSLELTHFLQISF